MYCPGTQHSSLFPSFLTKDLGQTIKKSKAKKFLITNIFFDKDIKSETANTLINKFFILHEEQKFKKKYLFSRCC